MYFQSKNSYVSPRHGGLRSLTVLRETWPANFTNLLGGGLCPQALNGI